VHGEGLHASGEEGGDEEMNKELFPIIYDDLYQQAAAVLREINPCKIRRASDGSVSCFESRKYGVQDGDLCCGGCKHLGVKGCRVEALACKVWLCHAVKQTKAGQRAMEALEAIAAKALQQRIPLLYRGTKEECLKVMR